MCGYFGLYGSREKTFQQVPHISLEHRGPDSSQEWSAPGIYLKHYRLAILGGDLGAQPMHSANSQWAMLFNGEIYNYVELAKEIGRPDLVEAGDSKVLLELVERFGISAINRCNGMFSIALYDKLNHKLYLIRDRFGVKPLYFTRSGDQVLFASEIKALINSSSELSYEVMENYLTTGQYPVDPQTFYKDIKQVVAGCYLEINTTQIKEVRYYDLEEHIEQYESQKLSLEEYCHLLEDATKIRLRSNRILSLHLSSGVDSLALGALARKVWDKEYPCYGVSMGFKEAEFDEAQDAGQRAGMLRFSHFTSHLSAEEVPALSEELQFYQDEPYGGVPTIAYYKMNKLERDSGMIVTLEGQGGDEALLGYRSHLCLATYDRLLANKRDDSTQKMLTALSMNQAQVIKASEKLIGSNFAAHTDLTAQRAVQSVQATPSKKGWLRALQLFDVLENKIPRTLRFNDRASAGTSREIRCPYLDYRVVAYGIALPLETKISAYGPKEPFRALIRRELKIDIPLKRSVVTPQTKWLQSSLRPWAEEHIGGFAKIYDTKVVNDYCQGAQQLLSKEKLENSFPVWQLINLSLLAKDFAKKQKMLN